jgi:hypothetical protein
VRHLPYDAAAMALIEFDQPPVQRTLHQGSCVTRIFALA